MFSSSVLSVQRNHPFSHEYLLLWWFMCSYTSDAGKNYDFNTADTFNTLLLNCMFVSGQLKEGEMYDVDFNLYG